MRLRPFLALGALAIAVSVFAQDSVHNAPITHVDLSVPDLTVVDQSGRQVAFNSGVIKDRVAVITSFFTTCTAFCPMTQERLARLAKVLGSRMGKDVVFVSVSVDPENDTPARMKAWGEKFHTGKGWTLVSGRKDDVQNLLKSLGLFVDTQRHQSFLVIGNQRDGWVRVSSWSSPESLAEVIDGLEKRTTAAR